MIAYDKKTAVALGFFDGVHLGHMSLINKAVSLAQGDTKALIYTFDMHPNEFFGKEISFLTDISEKKEILEQTAADDIYFQHITQEFLSLSPKEFIEDILCKQLNAKYVIAGENYTFGKNKLGTTGYLKSECEKRGISCIIMPYITHDGKIVSSSEIRRCIAGGDIKAANAMLGRHFSLSGSCMHGRCDGHKLGFPTANLAVPKQHIMPKNGVYCTLTRVDARIYPSITNVGFAPTFGDNPLIIETNILDFDGDIYDKHLCVEFIDILRPEKKFLNIDELKKQIQNDVMIRRNMYEKYC